MNEMTKSGLGSKSSRGNRPDIREASTIVAFKNEYVDFRHTETNAKKVLSNMTEQSRQRTPRCLMHRKQGTKQKCTLIC